MTIPFDPFALFQDRPFGSSGSANPFDQRNDVLGYSRPLKPIKVVAKRPTWQDITSGKVDDARAAIGARTAPTPYEVAEAIRNKAREAYASTDIGVGDVALAAGRVLTGKDADLQGGEFTRRAFRGAAYGDLATAGALSAFDPGITSQGVGETAQQFTKVSDETLSPTETIVPTLLGAAAGNIGAFMAGSRAFTAGLEGVGRTFGVKSLENAGARLAAMREARGGQSVLKALRAGDAAGAVDAAYTGTKALATRAVGELLPNVPINLAQGAAQGDEGGSLTVSAMRKLGFDDNAEFLEGKKGRVFGALENEAMDVLGFAGLEALHNVVRLKLAPTREVASTIAGAGIGAATDDENRARGAVIGGTLGLLGARADNEVGLSTRIVNGINDEVVAPFKAYSAGLRALGEAKQAKGDAGFWRATLLKGTRKAELDDTGVLQWLDQQSGTLTREQVASELQARLPKLGSSDRGFTGDISTRTAEMADIARRLDEIAKALKTESDPKARTALLAEDQQLKRGFKMVVDDRDRMLTTMDEERPTKYNDYVVPGENTDYGELVTTKEPPQAGTAGELGVGDLANWHGRTVRIDGIDPRSGDWRLVDADHGRVVYVNQREFTNGNIVPVGDERPYTSNHWDGAKNPLVHTRVSERTIDGERVLVVHDIQSDAHQKAREQGGYNDADYRATVEATKQESNRLRDQMFELGQQRRAIEDRVRSTTDTRAVWAQANAVMQSSNREIEQLLDAQVQKMRANGLSPSLPDDLARNMARIMLQDSPEWRAVTSRHVNLPSGDDAVLAHIYQQVNAHPDMQDWNARMDALQAEQERVGLSMPKNRRVPDLPFKKTPQWTELGLKRVIDEAQRRGIDRVVLPTGQQAADMFSLSKAADELTFRPEAGMFEARQNGRVIHSMQVDDASELHPVIGREMTEKLLAAPQASGSPVPMHVLRGDELNVGGAGMRSYYDQIVPSTVKDYAKKLGVKIELEKVGGAPEGTVRPGLLKEKAAAQGEYRRAVDELREARDARDQMDTSDYRAVDAANYRIRVAAERVADTDFYAKKLEQEFKEAMRTTRSREELADNLSFRITPEMKTAIRDGQPLYALGALTLAGDDRDDKSKLGAFAALAVGSMSRNILHGVPASALAKLTPEIRRMVESLDPETGYAPAAYAAARQMRETIAKIGRNPEQLLAKADSYQQLARTIRQGIRSGELTGPSHAFTADLAERFAIGMTALSEAAKTESSKAIKGERSVLESHQAVAAERVAKNPALVQIAKSGTHEQKVAAVIDYMEPLLTASLQKSMLEHGTDAKWYDEAIRRMGAMATMVMPELSDPHLFALFNYATSILSNGNPVSPELNAGLIVFQQFLRTGKFSIYHIDDATKQISRAIEIESSTGLKPRPIWAIGDDGDVLKSGLKFNSWEASLGKLNELLESHDGNVQSAVRELMDRGVTPAGKATGGETKDRLRATQLFGPKVGQYGTDKTMWMRAQLDHPFPEGVIENATNDLWMARGYNAALGQTPIIEKLDKKTGELTRVLDDGVDGPMHRVLNDVQRQLGERVGNAVLGRPLEARNVQALLWEGMKNESLAYGAGAKSGAFDTMETAMTNYLFGTPGTRSLEEIVGLATQNERPQWKRFVANRDQSTRPGYLSPLAPDELAGKRVTLLHGDRVGYALDEYGDLQNLFNNGGPKGAGREAAFHAIENGASTLDAFDGHLPKLYAQMGFVETGRMKFNREFAPPGWDYATNGEPDVVFMAWHGFPDGEAAARARALGPVDEWMPHDRTDQYFDDYADAQRNNRRAYAAGAGAAGRHGEDGVAGMGGAARRGDLGAGANAGRSLKNRPGSVAPGALGAIAGGAAGGALGAYAGAKADGAIGNDVSTREGAVVGLLGGLVAGAGGGGALLHRLPGLLAARRGVNLLAKSPDVAEVVKTIATGARQLSEPPTIFGTGLAATAHRAYAAMVDDVYALRQLGRQVAGDKPLTGIDAQMRQSNRWLTWADKRLRDQLRPVLEEAKGREGDVMALVKARRDLQLRAQGAADKSDLAIDVLQRAKAELEQDPKTVAAADGLQDYYRSLLDWKLDEKIITPEEYQNIVASEDYYTPFLREWERQGLKGDGAGGFLGGGKVYNRSNGVRKLDREQQARAKTIDPFEIAVMDTHQTAQLVGKQRVMQMISGMIEANGGEIPGVLRRAPKDAKPDPLARRFEAIVNGQRFTYEVLDPDVYKAIQSFGPKTRVPAILRAVKEFKRAAITTLPDFAIRNVIRDNAQVAVINPVSGRAVVAGALAGAGAGVASAANEPGDIDWGTAAWRAMAGAGVGVGGAVLLPQLARTMRGVTDILAASHSPVGQAIGRWTGGNGAIWNQFLEDGGASIGHYAKSLQDARSVLTTLRGESVASQITNPKHWYHALEQMGNTLENAPRLATYKTALERGASRVEAAAEAADVSLDFSRKGGSPFQQGLNETNAFLNARIQGWDKMGRMLKDPRTYAVGFAALTAPSIGNWIAIHEDGQSKENYYEHPTWVRNTFWLVPKGDGKFLYIPKPFELGMIFSSIPERMLDWAYTNGKFDGTGLPKSNRGDAMPAESALHTAAEAFNSTVSTEIPVTDVLKPVLEQSINYDMFRNRPIVPSENYSSSKTLPEFQSDDRTSKVAKALGERLGLSPQRLDHVIGAYGGSAGKLATRAIDKVLPGEDRSPTADRTPIIGDMIAGFTDRKGQTSDDEVTIARRYDRVQRVTNAIRPLMKVLEDESATPERRNAAQASLRLVLEQHRGDLGQNGEHLDGLTAANEAITQLRDAAKEVQRTPGLSLADRKAQLEGLQKIRARVARLAVAGHYDQIEALMQQLQGAGR